MEIKLRAEKRSDTGKGPAGRLRAGGEVPGVLYGPGTEPCPLKVKKEDLYDAIHGAAGTNVLIDLTLADGRKKENHLVMIKELQRHPYKSLLLHVDFLKVARDEKVTTKVPIAIVGEEESVGLRAGGTLQHVLWEVEVECLPSDLPDHIQADISRVEIGQHISVAQLDRRPGVSVLNDPEDTVLTILAPRIHVEEEEVAVEAAEEEEVAPAEEKPAEEGPTPEGKGES